MYSESHPQPIKISTRKAIAPRAAEVASVAKKEKPNYWLRRAGAVAAVSGVLAAGAVMFEAAKGAYESKQPTEPNREQVAEHPENYVPITIGRNQTLSEVARQHTDANHDYRANEEAYRSQLGHTNVTGGELLMVTPTTPPTEVPAEVTTTTQPPRGQ